MCEAFSQIEQFAFTLGAKACKGMQNSRFPRMAQTWLHCTDHRWHAKEILFRQLGELRSMAICTQGSKLDKHACDRTVPYLSGGPYEAQKSCGYTRMHHLLPRQGFPITPDGTVAGLQSGHGGRFWRGFRSAHVRVDTKRSAPSNIKKLHILVVFIAQSSALGFESSQPKIKEKRRLVRAFTHKW
jgi:hypothetical protein